MREVGMADEPDSNDQHRATEWATESAGDADVLRSAWFLDPLSPVWEQDRTRMPDPVWDRLSQALREQADERSVAPGVTSILQAPRRGRRMQAHGARGWLVGSVAAGVALLAAGIVVQSVQSSREAPVVVAGESVSGSLTRSAQGPAALPLLAASSPAPARRVLASGTDYQPQTLRSQVVSLLGSLGARQPSDFAGVGNGDQQTAGSSGFTATLPALRACITGLTNSDLAQALVVDRALFDGDDAGLVVIPKDFVPRLGDATPTARAATPDGNVDIWVVEPDCSQMDTGVILHLLHQFADQ